MINLEKMRTYDCMNTKLQNTGFLFYDINTFDMSTHYMYTNTQTHKSKQTHTNVYI